MKKEKLNYFEYLELAENEYRRLVETYPELCELSSYEYSGWVTATPQVDIANYKGPITAIALFFSLLATVLWLINILPYIGRISKSREFLERVVKAYDEEGARAFVNGVLNAVVKEVGVDTDHAN